MLGALVLARAWEPSSAGLQACLFRPPHGCSALCVLLFYAGLVIVLLSLAQVSCQVGIGGFIGT